MTNLIERISDLERQLIVEEDFAPLEQALPMSGLAGQQFHACLARQGRQQIDVHAFLAWQNQTEADLGARASALRRALEPAVAFFNGRVAVTFFLVAEAAQDAEASFRALRGVAPGHFLEKIQFAIASADISRGEVHFEGRAGLDPGQDWFESRLQSGSQHSHEEVKNILSLREDEEQSSRRFLSMRGLPWATYALIGLNLGMFGATFAVAGSLFQAQAAPNLSLAGQDALREQTQQLALMSMGANQGSLVFGQGQFWRLAASLFVHANLMHLIMNMMALYSLGSLVERLAGPLRMLLIYFCAGLLGSCLSALLNGDMPSVGASGAILGLAGALLALHWRRPPGFPKLLAERLYGSLVRPIAFIFILGVGLALFNSRIVFDNWAHFGGLSGGLALIFLWPGLLKRGLDRLG